MFTKIHRLPEDGQKTALVIRLGAWGDMVWVSTVVRRLKHDGFNVTVHCSERGYEVIKHAPNIDRFVVVKDGELDAVGLEPFWEMLGKNFDKVVNLTGSHEDNLLLTPNTIDPLSGESKYNWPYQRVHLECNRNYMDETMKIAGYPEDKGLNGELFFTEEEETWAQKFLAEHPGFFVVWALGGSSVHKAYPYSEVAADEIFKRHADVQMVTVGDDWCKLLEFTNPRAIRKSGEFGIRKSLVLTKYADLVIGPESAVINAASCFDTPKILLLSHSSVENLSKYWSNTTNLFSAVPCYPCHKIHYTLDCPVVEEIRAPVCMGTLRPERLVEAVEKVYTAWQAKRAIGVPA